MVTDGQAALLGDTARACGTLPLTSASRTYRLRDSHHSGDRSRKRIWPRGTRCSIMLASNSQDRGGTKRSTSGLPSAAVWVLSRAYRYGAARQHASVLKRRRDVGTARSDGDVELRRFCRVLLAIRNVDDMSRFLKDLLSPAELHNAAHRWNVVVLVKNGLPYTQIRARSGASTTTIARAKTVVDGANGGFRTALERIGRHSMPKETDPCRSRSKVRPGAGHSRRGQAATKVIRPHALDAGEPVEATSTGGPPRTTRGGV